MNIVFTARKSSSVFQAIKGNFTGPADLNLILGKGTRIEVYLIGRDGLKLVKGFGIYGEIACLEPFRPPGHTTDMLLVTTTHYDMLTLSLRLTSADGSADALANSASQFSIISDTLTDLRDRHNRPSDAGQILIIDPSSLVICCHLYQGLLKCITVNPNAPIPTGSGGQSMPQPGRSAPSHNSRSSRMGDKTFVEQFNLPIEEVTIMSMVFLHGCLRPTLVVLYQDKKEIRHVKTYELDIKSKEKSETGWSQSGLTGAHTCIAVPSPIGGFLVVGEYSISYFNPAQRTSPRSITINPTIMQCYNRVDDQGNRYLLGDIKGQLYILVLVLGDVPGPSTSSSSAQPIQAFQVEDLKLEVLGTTSIPEAIVYLDNDHAFIGSHLGDSQLVLLHTEADQNGEYLEVMETFTNIAPVSDFEVVDLEGQGQGQIVACSGGFKDGSLRIVRNGVGINDRAVLELPGIKGLWSLKQTLDSATEDTLVMSFLNSTRVVRVTSDAEMVQEEIEGLLNDSQTLLSGNVQANLILQVTPRSVRLIAPPQHIQAGLIAEWKPPSGQLISVASMNPMQCVVAVAGQTLVYLDIGSEEIREVGRTTFENEIACIDITPIDVGKNNASQVCAVGLWTNVQVLLVRLPTMETLASHSLQGDILPRSLLLSRFEGVPYLLVGLGDGQLLTFMLDATLATFPTPKRISLGTQPIMLRQISSSNEGGPGESETKTNHVFACSDRPTVIYSSNRKLLLSNVNLKQVATVASFNCEAFPNALAIVGSDEEGVLRIGSIDEFQELHVQTFPIHESPRRIAHLASKKCFGVLTIKVVSEEPEAMGSTKMVSCDEVEVGFVRLYDDQTFELLHTYELQKEEAPQCISAVTFAGDTASYIAVGTADSVSEGIPTKGRILILEVTESNQLKLITELEVKGGVMSIKGFQGKLLCGVNEQLRLYSWTPSDKLTSTAESNLALECSRRGFILILSLAIHGEFIVAMDLIRSMTLLRYTEKKIEEIARDACMDMLTSLEAIDDETFIAADNASSIFTLVKNTETTSEDEAKRLQWSGGWHLGDQINRFKHGSLVMTSQEGDAPAVPKLLFATVSGAIGVVASLTPEKYELLHQLEINMARVIKGVGGLDHAAWRQFRSDTRTLPSTNFVDGDLIELFLDLSQDEINDVLTGTEASGPVNASVEEVTKLVEELSRLH
ncbi:DNA damage-binding protein 1a [Lobosporangium transversale]|uniref:DNA damage-binding protein 1 n=1 Tax=Lobosporangium transversale TaxID=64571 RepID=A0A1Y2GIW5_9FUNG|nr:DNA damage-binding protein 1 [Lobosporangium transversale]KAF9902706.1 DNA damage-binding protein 1a [Lobosporangium transversale]ORZ12126.1 DNA damage-binding protein 1 [Lobosporangium transversale]|eukprot:XP_021879991.1 DNA damage-binding protein 1 [Lobosporangium transversale]